MNGKTAPKLYKQAREAYDKKYLLDALDDISWRKPACSRFRDGNTPKKRISMPAQKRSMRSTTNIYIHLR
jgi:hypothetical protein